MAVVKRTKGTLTPKKKMKKETEASTDLSLPSEVSVASDALGDYSLLLFGRKKVGKTKLSSMFPETFHMMTEPGGKALNIYQRPIVRWSDFTGYVKLLDKSKQFKTQVIDTADILFQLCSDDVCRKRGIDHPSDEEWGKGWSAVRNEFTKWIQRLMGNGRGTIFISHATEREIKRRSGGSYHSIQPTLSGQARDVLEGMVDIFAYFDYKEDQRILTIRGDETIAAGNRLEQHFRWNGVDVPEIAMGRSAEEGYKNLIACFKNKYPYTPSMQVEEAPTLAVVKKLKVRA
jgi:hypothetical protein